MAKGGELSISRFEPCAPGLSFIHSQGFKEFAAIQRAIFLDKSMAAKAAVFTRWMEISPARRILCSQTRRNSLSGKRLDTIAEERTLTNEELLVDVQSGFDNISNLEFMDGKNGTITQREL